VFSNISEYRIERELKLCLNEKETNNCNFWRENGKI
jgi:hypothetical protein